MKRKSQLQRFALCASLLVLTLAGRLDAHDFWIEASNFRPAIGEKVVLGLRVGQHFIGDGVPRSAQLFEAFTARDGSGEHPVMGFENQDPAGYLQIVKPGITTIIYRSKANPLQLPPEKFADFLQQEGLQRIAALRAQQGETNKPDRERFFRFAKALLRTGKAPDASYKRVAGLRYEIVLESDPWKPAPLRVRVLFEGKPLKDSQITAIHQEDPAAVVTVRSDANGRAVLNLPKNGVWLIKSVQLIPAPAGSDADWESLWASLTFER